MECLLNHDDFKMNRWYLYVCVRAAVGTSQAKVGYCSLLARAKVYTWARSRYMECGERAYNACFQTL